MENKHTHTHTHDPAEVKKIANKLSRSVGHLNKVKTMVENNDDCSDVLIQLAAVKGELNKIGKDIIKQHLEHCLVHARIQVQPWKDTARLVLSGTLTWP